MSSSDAYRRESNGHYIALLIDCHCPLGKCRCVPTISNSHYMVMVIAISLTVLVRLGNHEHNRLRTPTRTVPRRAVIMADDSQYMEMFKQLNPY